MPAAGRTTEHGHQQAIGNRREQLNKEQPQTLDQAAATISRERTPQTENGINDIGLNSAANTNAEFLGIPTARISNDTDKKRMDME